MRAPSAMLPTGLSVINYLSFGTPAWTPFIPIYRGLPPAALPPATQGADVDVPDNSTLFWHSRQLSALIFQAGWGVAGGWRGASGRWRVGLRCCSLPPMLLVRWARVYLWSSPPHLAHGFCRTGLLLAPGWRRL